MILPPGCSAWVSIGPARSCAGGVAHRRRWGERCPEGLGAVGEPTVEAALAELGEGQRSVIICRYYLGLSEAETAVALDIRPGTVKSRLHRGLQQLQGRLGHLRQEEQR